LQKEYGMAVQITKKEFEKLKMKVNEMEEILSILFDRELMESVARGKKDIDGGKVISLEEYEKMIDTC
jgi:hypothetical protein